MTSIKETYHDQKRKVVQQRMYYNRFLIFRYSLAFFLFTNLYWFVSFLVEKNPLGVIPFLIIILSIPAIYEQIKLNGDTLGDAIELSATKRYFIVQTGLNILLIILGFSSWGINSLFAFLTNTRKSMLFLVIALGVGAILSLANLRQMTKIKNNSDNVLKAIQEFEKANWKEEKNDRRK